MSNKREQFRALVSDCIDYCTHSFSPSATFTTSQELFKSEKQPPVKESLPSPQPVHRPLSTPKPPASSTSSSKTIKSSLSQILPSLRLTDHVPDDSQGRKLSSAWQEKSLETDVLLLAFDLDESSLELLKSLAKAIDERLCKAKILSAQKWQTEEDWQALLNKRFRLIIASSSLHKNSVAHAFFNKAKQIPLLLIEESSVYKRIEKKAQLWKAICQILKS